jgi:GH15 family glucan-1,4-alpha-glucosidase
MEKLGAQAATRWNQPDAGPWELRTRIGVHTYSAVMCWAACDRLAKIAAALDLEERTAHWRGLADEIRAGIVEQAWNPAVNSFTSVFGGDEADGSLLLMPQIGIVAPSDPRFLGTLDFIEKRLRRGNYLYRYAAADDFGVPETAFTVCTFWLIDALHMVGRVEEARELFEHMLSCRTSLGLLSEDIDCRDGHLWGNFPQTYSMVGLIQSAMRLSQPWTDAF